MLNLSQKFSVGICLMFFVLSNTFAENASEKFKIIVGFDVAFRPEGYLNHANAATQRLAIRQGGDRVLQALDGMDVSVKARYHSIPFVAMSVNKAALRHLKNLPMVTSIEEDLPESLHLQSSNAVIGTPTAWADGFDGSGQVVAILDTGVDLAHPWFNTPTSKIVSEACYSTTDANFSSVCPGGVASSTAPGSGDWCGTAIDGCAHGTAVAGIVAGNDGMGPNFGVARGADLIVIQTFSQKLTGSCGTRTAPCTQSFSSDLVSGLQRVFDLRTAFNIAAVNISIGGGQFFSQCDDDNTSEKAAIDNLRSVEIATIISSGNDGWVDSIGRPGCISSAISVGATDDTDAIASFSNIYPFLHFLAPGVNIDTADPLTTVAGFSGTSGAAPHVAGAWALLKEKFPTASVEDIQTILHRTAKHIDDLRTGGTAKDLRRINLGKAIVTSATPTVSLDFRGPSHGTVDIRPVGLKCSVDCSFKAGFLQELELIAVPEDGYIGIFVGCDHRNPERNCVLTPLAGGDIRVRFVKPVHQKITTLQTISDYLSFAIGPQEVIFINSFEQK